MKRLLCIFMLFLCFLGSGCSTTKNEVIQNGRRDKSTVVLAAYRNLAPGNKDAVYCSRILGVWEPLITKDDHNRPAPCLASAWEMREGGREWIFYLRKDVYFHNGSKFTADSVVKNFDRMKKGYKRSSFYGLDINVYYPTLIKYEKLDEYSFRLVFTEPNVNQLYKMTDFGSPMFAPECFDEDGNFKSIAIGTGPYKIVENVLNKYVKIVRNENYYGAKGKINEYIIRTIPAAETRFSALKSGEIDAVLDINAIPPFMAEEIKKDPRFEAAKNKSTMIRYLSLNGNKFPFNDVRMRKAVSLAINRKLLVNSLYIGYGEPTVNILNYTSPYYKKIPVKHDLEKAKKLAKEVLGEKRYAVTYCINSKEVIQKGEAELIAYWLKEIGLDVTIKSLEYATLTRMMKKGECDIVRLQRGLANGDAYGLLYTFFAPKGSVNKSYGIAYDNADVTELLRKVKHVTDDAERQRIFDHIQDIVAEEQPVVPLFNDVNIVAYNKRIKNYKPLIYGVDLSKVELVEGND